MRAQPHDEALTLGSREFPLGATLVIPDATHPVPAVVLVHGSGPFDRDETVGKTKLFADLAALLPALGIAVLRYDKRTFAYREQLRDADLTLDSEVVDDAVAAVHALSSRRDVSSVIVVGHSLGGMLAPEIAMRARTAGDRVAGVVMIAPPGRAPWEIIRGQLQYLHASPAARREIEKAITVIDIGGSADLLGIPWSYWQDWAHRDGVAMAKRLGKPLLVLHGDRDYQVLDADIAVWRSVGSLARFVTLPGDNHALIKGSGPPSPDDYRQAAHVDPRAVTEIAGFIRSLR